MRTRTVVGQEGVSNTMVVYEGWTRAPTRRVATDNSAAEGTGTPIPYWEAVKLLDKQLG